MAESWIDAADSRVSEDSPALDQWWTLFHDPVLDRLILQDATLQELIAVYQHTVH